MYQGHKNRTHWNVALYLSNDYSLYCMVGEELSVASNRDEAAHNIFDRLRQAGVDKTPDGYKYSVASIRAALVGWEA